MDIAGGTVQVLDAGESLFPTVITLPARDVRLLLYYNEATETSTAIDLDDIGFGPFAFFDASDAE